ncbi:MAG: VOC family protein [Oscillospiraceae bacterium]|nr:VOC family protein [Oscillospiraceae bacterium]
MFQHYLMFGGDCEDALKTYEKAFGGKISEICKYGDQEGFAEKEEQKNLVMHSTFVLDGGNIMCADYPYKTTPGDNTFVMPSLKTVGRIKKAWDVLKENAVIFEDLAPCFFAEIYGTLRDKHGINWMLMIEKEPECTCTDECASGYNPNCTCTHPDCHCREADRQV